MPAKITTKTVTKILDNMALGGSQKIAAAAKVSAKTVLSVAEAFPLWNFLRKNNRDPAIAKRLKMK